MNNKKSWSNSSFRNGSEYVSRMLRDTNGTKYSVVKFIVEESKSDLFKNSMEVKNV